ncbi:alpha/beta hydrolase family protein [Curtobacterium pusillum]|uniref:alpha/beta hydrolase family protein n=1 Tax=Curtobacterium pusillum TaxID=69373 RepID=UPI0011A1B18F|nr:alpha/beta fold hydrolase [Curtobacterium pusillum]
MTARLPGAASRVDPARARVLELLGLPSLDSLRPTAVRVEPLGSDEAVESSRVELDTADGDTVPCLLLTPHGRHRADVIAVHQHAGDFVTGKSEPAGRAGDPTLAYGATLAAAGARVIMPDLLGFEDRRRAWADDPAADERLDALFRVANGSSLQAKHTSDIATVTSWMTETNPTGAGPGIIGHSLGGQVALFALAVDSRLSSGVVSCGLGTLASFEAARIRHNPAWFVPGLAAAGDVALIAAAVDRPLLVASGTDDALFPLDGVHHVLDAFRPDVVTAELFPGGHTMPPHVTAAAVRRLVPA